MPATVLFLRYVSDAEDSTAFYSYLFEIAPTFTSPRHGAFAILPGVLLALWTGLSEHAVLNPPRARELVMVPGTASAVDETFTRRPAKEVPVVEEPKDDAFGCMFMITDPNGNLIRVCPVD